MRGPTSEALSFLPPTTRPGLTDGTNAFTAGRSPGPCFLPAPSRGESCRQDWCQQANATVPRGCGRGRPAALSEVDSGVVSTGSGAWLLLRTECGAWGTLTTVTVLESD